jgi:hypothetical protein
VAAAKGNAIEQEVEHLHSGLSYKRLSQGRFHWWPTATAPSVRLSARELTVLLWNGFPERAQMAPEWRQVA